MLKFRLTITPEQRKALNARLLSARQRGDLRTINFVLAVLAVVQHHYDTAQVARTLQLSEAQVENYVRQFLIYGAQGVGFKKPVGRKPKLTKAQKHELGELLDQGPQACGFDGGCWRSPMIQELIQQRFHICYNVFYIAQLLRNLGFSFQKARFTSDHLNTVERQRWRQHTWPQALQTARARNAWLLFGDEASFPQWGTLNYSWSRRGVQPVVKTSGVRKGYKVFGLIDYFTGRFFYQTTTARLNSATYIEFLTQVLAQTERDIVLIQDGARYHTSAALKAFFATHAARLVVYQLPSYSPDFNPIEGLWKKIKQHDTHLVYFPTFESLTTKVDAALLKFANRAAEILALFGVGA